MQIILSLSIALFAGLMLSRLAKLVELPAVTAYLVAGILVGPYCLGALDIGFIKELGIEGLGFISHDHVKSFSLIYFGSLLLCGQKLHFKLHTLVISI